MHHDAYKELLSPASDGACSCRSARVPAFGGALHTSPSQGQTSQESERGSVDVKGNSVDVKGNIVDVVIHPRVAQAGRQGSHAHFCVFYGAHPEKTSGCMVQKRSSARRLAHTRRRLRSTMASRERNAISPSTCACTEQTIVSSVHRFRCAWV
eukprot:4711551-Pyramimonas_sp.AAC.1